MAIEMLASWANPPGRDRVVGLWRPIPPRPARPAADALKPLIADLLKTAPSNVRHAAVRAAAELGMKAAGPPLAALIADSKQSDRNRAAALDALDKLEDPGRVAAAQRTLIMQGSRSRTQALRVLAKVDPAVAIAPVQDRLLHGTPAERQGAIAVLAAMPGEAPRRALLDWLDRLIAGKVSPEIQLDLLEAAGRRSEPEFRRKLEAYESSKPKDDPLAHYREALAGGDRERGMALFTAKSELECIRCHKIKGLAGEQSGGEVGPDLSGVGARQNRAYLLESIVYPSKQIAQGFESVVLATSDGKVHSGILRGEDDKEVRLMTVEGKPVTVSKELIEERRRGPSAMPDDLSKKLSKVDLRDLVEFLANQRG